MKLFVHVAACVGAIAATLVVATAIGQSRFVPPGACVAIPNNDWILERRITPSQPSEHQDDGFVSDEVRYSSSRVADLDGDGVLDAYVAVPEQGDCVDDMHLALYIVRRGCGHYVGTVEGRIQRPPTRGAARLPDLTTIERETVQIGPRDTVMRVHTRVYHFDGTLYREVSHSQTDSNCDHCSSDWCTHRRR